MHCKSAKLLPFLLISLPCADCHAQDDYEKHQIFAGYGFGYTNRVFAELGEAFGVDFLQSVFSDSTDEGRVMPLYMGYRYFVRKHLSIGFTLAYPLMGEEANQSPQSKTADKQKFHAIIFMPRVDAVYVNKKMFSLYSGLSAGMMIENKDAVDAQQANVAPAYHITALGLFVGKSIGLFTELGYGVNGILSLGVAAKFGGEDFQKQNAEDAKGAKKKTFTPPCIRL